MNALVFGAGNIGRGFLGERLFESGYSVTFVDANQTVIDQLNNFREYPIFVVTEEISELLVQDVRAISVHDVDAVASAIVETSLILTAVGKDQLPRVAPVLAVGLMKRLQKRPRSGIHVMVVACENAEENTAALLREVLLHVPESMRGEVVAFFSFPNCVVDRIAPDAGEHRREHPLAVVVEKYFQLAIDGSALKQEAPVIDGLMVSSDLRAVLDQKLLTLNMAHAVIAYWGYLRGCQYIHEAIMETDIRALASGALTEVEQVVIGLHPTILLAEQQRYAAGILKRFENHHLRDEITRVARDPRRKLSATDRLVRPAMFVVEHGYTPAFLSSGIAAALHYDFSGDQQAKELAQAIHTHGVSGAFEIISGIKSANAVSRTVESQYLLRAL